MICKKCVEYATNAYKFKTHCERTEALLQTYISKRVDSKNPNGSCQNDTEEDEMEETEVLIIKEDEHQESNEEEVLEQQEEIEEDGDEKEELKVQRLDEDEVLDTVQEVIINPDIITDSESVVEILNENEQCEDKYDVVEDNNENEAAFVASSEENVRLRQRIAMKKMRNMENSLLTNKPNILKRRKNYCYPCKENEKGNYFMCTK